MAKLAALVALVTATAASGQTRAEDEHSGAFLVEFAAGEPVLRPGEYLDSENFKYRQFYRDVSAGRANAISLLVVFGLLALGLAVIVLKILQFVYEILKFVLLAPYRLAVRIRRPPERGSSSRPAPRRAVAGLRQAPPAAKQEKPAAPSAPQGRGDRDTDEGYLLVEEGPSASPAQAKAASFQIGYHLATTALNRLHSLKLDPPEVFLSAIFARAPQIGLGDADIKRIRYAKSLQSYSSELERAIHQVGAQQGAEVAACFLLGTFFRNFFMLIKQPHTKKVLQGLLTKMMDAAREGRYSREMIDCLQNVQAKAGRQDPVLSWIELEAIRVKAESDNFYR